MGVGDAGLRLPVSPQEPDLSVRAGRRAVGRRVQGVCRETHMDRRPVAVRGLRDSLRATNIHLLSGADVIEKTGTLMFTPTSPFGAPGEYAKALAAKLADLRFQVIREMEAGRQYKIQEFIRPLGKDGPGSGIAITVSATIEWTGPGAGLL